MGTLRVKCHLTSGFYMFKGEVKESDMNEIIMPQMSIYKTYVNFKISKTPEYMFNEVF